MSLLFPSGQSLFLGKILHMLAFYLLVMSGLELQHSYKMLKSEYNKFTVATMFLLFGILQYFKFTMAFMLALRITVVTGNTTME